ncbi:MAG TPA: hypothetical protein DD827_04935 [Gammaproteobacteria bacterium]|jgi:hypothetical protein|nr:hypothetical protein [Gammaproteobacteria bacterium]
MAKSKNQLEVKEGRGFVRTPVQLELFGSTRQLNLSKTYVSIPKEVSPKDPMIHWESKNIALPIEKAFSVDGETGLATHISEIKPANIKNPKTGIYKSYFPHFRELKLENALISLISKFWQSVSYHGEGQGGSVYRIELTIYQIQKEIIDAMNLQDGTDKKVNDCPFNTTSVREGLAVLKETTYVVRDAETGKQSYSFNRIKDFFINEDNGKVLIEIGTMVSEYISRGDWNVADSTSILASSNYYTMKLRMHLNLYFRFAKRGAFYNISMARLIEKIDFREYPTKRMTMFKLVKLIESLHEVREVVSIPKKDGRKIVGAVFHIFPSDSFIQSMIEANKLHKRTQNALIENDLQKALIEPLESDFVSVTEYHEAKRKYDIAKGKILHARLHSN